MNLLKKIKNRTNKQMKQSVTNQSIKLENKVYNYKVIRKDIKHTYIKIKPTGITVTTNFYTSLEQIEVLLRKHKHKIIPRLAQFSNSKSQNTLGNHQLYYLGKIYDIKQQQLNNYKHIIQNNHIIFNQGIKVNENTIDRFYREQAQLIFNERLDVIHQAFIRLNVQKPIVKIRKMKSRYGTCYYNDGKIILNRFLIQCKIEHIDYVIAHELCHFIYHDHGKGFKYLLETIIPDWRDRKIELNRHFSRLMS